MSLRLGLIGAGHWGQAYIRTISALPDLELARVASRNPDTAALVGPSCAVSTDWHEVASARDLDGVIVAAPPALHAEIASAALRAGLPVLVEKPLAMSAAQAQELLALARRVQGFALVDHIYLFHPAYAELKRRARGLGKPRLVLSEGGRLGPFRPDTPPLWDFGPHDVALALDLMGEKPKDVQAASRPRGRGELIDIRLDFAGGAQARLCVGNGFEARKRMFSARFGEQALTLDDAGNRRLVLSRLDGQGQPQEPGEEIPVSRELPLTKAVESFAAAIRAGSKDLSSLELGVSVVETLARCETAKRG